MKLNLKLDQGVDASIYIPVLEIEYESVLVENNQDSSFNYSFECNYYMSFTDFWTIAIILLIVALLLFWLGIASYRVYCFSARVNYKNENTSPPGYLVKCFFIFIKTFGDGKINAF